MRTDGAPVGAAAAGAGVDARGQTETHVFRFDLMTRAGTAVGTVTVFQGF